MARGETLPHARATALAARDRQYPSARRADADHRALARPWRRAAGHRDRDRRQSAPAIRGGACRTRRRPFTSSISSRRMPSASTPSSRRARRTRKLERVPMLRGRIVAANGIKAEDLKPRAEHRLGAAKRPRHHLYRRHSARLARGRRPMVGRRLSGPAADLVREENRRGSRSQDRRSGDGERARPQHHRHTSPTCARSTGKASASISCWSIRPAPSAARRTRISRR